MASLTIRDLDDVTKERLRRRAAARSRSMEEEVRHILREAVASDDQPVHDLGQRIVARFSGLGGVDLAMPAREAVRAPPEVGEP